MQDKVVQILLTAKQCWHPSTHYLLPWSRDRANKRPWLVAEFQEGWTDLPVGWFGLVG
jgi:hypothetical protein